MSTHADFLVIGLGAMGSAVLYQLAKRGAKVVGIDRYAPPHAHGSSHGETRITRRAVGEGRSYVPLVMDAHRIWRELEAETGIPLLEESGVLIIAPGSGQSSHHGKPDFVARSIETAQEFGIAHEGLTGSEVAKRFPQFTNLQGNEKAYFEAGGGYVFPERCVAAQLQCAARLGAVIRTGVQALSISQAGSGVRVATTDGALEAGEVIVAAGGWAASLLGKPFDRLLTVNRQVLHWYALDSNEAYAGPTPAFIWMHGATDVDYLYGFPPLPGENRIKVATEQYESTTTPDDVTWNVDPSESAEMYDLHVRGRLAGVTPNVAQASACLYTVTPDNGFIIDRHPLHDRIFVVSACSGHGFKHSAGIGNLVAKAMCTDDSVDLSPFAVSRFDLWSDVRVATRTVAAR